MFFDKNINLKKIIFPLVIIVYIFLVVTLIKGDYLNENPNWENNLTKIQLSALSWGDIDNNGYDDLVAIGACGIGCYSSKVYLNNGTSLNENQTWQQNLTSLTYGSLVLGDINNDGNLDLIISGCSSGVDETGDLCSDGATKTLVYINNGTSFIKNSIWGNNLTSVYRSSLTLGDINNDGMLDLNLNGDTGVNIINKIYINNGTSFVESPQWQNNLTGVRYSSGIFGDIDNDKSLDLIISGEDVSNNPRTKIYLNNGTTLNENSTWEQNLAASEQSSLAFADFNNDGKLDLSLIGGYDIHRIYINNGTSFTEINREVTGDLVGVFAGSQAFGDYNTDGYLDLITNGREGYTTLYLYNLSNENFIDNIFNPTESTVSNLKWSSIAWIDLDKDRDLDLIEMGYDGLDIQGYVYISNRSLTKPNTLPTPPNNFTSNYSTANNTLTLTWNNGSDNETQSTGLYYNLMVGNSTTNHTIVSGVYGGSSNPTAGYFGNMMERRNITLNVNLSNGDYYWYVQTIDTGLAKSDWGARQSFTVGTDITPAEPVTQPGGGSSGGGSGIPATSFWTKTEVISNENLNTGFEKELGTRQRIKVNISGEEHYIGIININSSLGRATINISSNPIQITLGINEEAKINISNSFFYDIYVKLNNIANSKANLTIKAIYEEITGNSENKTVETNENPNNKKIIDIPNTLFFILILIIPIAIILVITGIFFYLRRINRRRKNGSNKNR